MIYQWKIPGLIPIDAQTAGEELHRIYQKNGCLDAHDIVNESRSDDAPLHQCFEWDDEKAAEKYRENQAKDIVRSIIITQEKPNHEAIAVRAFVSVQESYHPIEVVVNSAEQYSNLLKSALAELKAFEKKYAILSELNVVFDAIKEIVA